MLNEMQKKRFRELLTEVEDIHERRKNGQKKPLKMDSDNVYNRKRYQEKREWYAEYGKAWRMKIKEKCDASLADKSQ